MNKIVCPRCGQKVPWDRTAPLPVFGCVACGKISILDWKTLGWAALHAIMGFGGILSMMHLNDIWYWMYFHIPILWMVLVAAVLMFNIRFIQMMWGAFEEYGDCVAWQEICWKYTIQD